MQFLLHVFAINLDGVPTVRVLGASVNVSTSMQVDGAPGGVRSRTPRVWISLRLRLLTCARDVRAVSLA
ncbi:MAG: hypothetical protein ACREMY_07770, partial [bacterium]